MAALLQPIRSGLRLASGALKLPLAARHAGPETAKLISVDIFGTLVARWVDDYAAWRAGATECAAVAARHGLAIPPDPVALRRDVELRLCRKQAAAGREPEFTHARVFQEMFNALGAGEWAADAAQQVADWQLEREIAWTYRVAAVADWVAELAKSGKRIVAVSDTRYTGEQLSTLLSRHGISGIGAIYASVDYEASKFSGRLFDRVADLERVRPAEILHVGDDLLRDALAPSQRGSKVRRVRRPPPIHDGLRPPAIGRSDPGFLLGYETIGPVLAAFTEMLFARARRDGIRRLAFVARDGELPFRVAEILASANPQDTTPALSYVFLSRRSTACTHPDLWKLGSDPKAVDRLIAVVQKIRLMGTFREGFQTYFQIPGEWIKRHSRRLNLTTGSQQDVRVLLSDASAVAELQETLAPARERLRRYLRQEKLLLSDTALVDVGWRGSILDLVRLEAAAESLPGPGGYFVGLWSDDAARFSDSAVGLICDQRRSRSLHEGAAFHSSIVLEAACRENRGVTIGYVDAAGGAVTPLFVDDGATREAEREAGGVHDSIRDGVLAYARWFSSSPRPAVGDETLRLAAQQRLFRLAFFPTAEQRAVGRSLLYSESTSDQRALSLISDRGKGIRNWIGGLRSPWKGGYLSEHGGQFPAALYCLAEGIMSWMPGSKPALRRVLIRGG